MSLWQHTFLHWNAEDLAGLDAGLTRMGSAGWELVSVVPGQGIPFDEPIDPAYPVHRHWGVHPSLLLFLKRPMAG
jgi:hypothetical protein